MRSYQAQLLVVLLGSIVFGIASAVLVDIAIDALTIRWPGPVTMALPTAICFVCTGVAILLLGYRR